MWQPKQTEGFVELESDYARLLKCEDGKKWSSIIVTPESDIWTALKKAIPSFFAPKVTLNFVCSYDGGTSVFGFPGNLTDKEIEGNLQVNRKNLFNEPEELFFKLKKGSVNQVTQQRDITVSYVKKSIIENIKNLCEIVGVKLGKITTLPDSLLGALSRQYYKSIGKEVNICIQIGFSKVFIIIFRGNEILSVRSLLTGSLREMESVLFAGYSLVREEARLMISGKHPEPVPAILNTIKENRLDLITHLGGIFAELRSKKLLDQNSKVYLSFDVIDEPQLTNMISDRFDVAVNIITGLEDDETCAKYEDYPAAWLCGALNPNVPNLIPPVKVTVGNIFYNPVMAILIAVLVTAVPYPLLKKQEANISNELNQLKEKHQPVEQLLNSFKEMSDYQAKLVNLAREINTDIEKRGISSRIARSLTEDLPISTRLENLQVDYKSGKFTVVGYTVDAESAIRYLDTVKSCDELTKAEIVISDLESRRIKFTITALIGDGKGRK